ncbi:unnamed protein product [Cercospora beticola]|nr:unnamed protein product [Cercospora beticola]
MSALRLYHGFLQKYPLRATFERIFSSPSAEGTEAWMKLIPRGKGFVYINNETQLQPMPGLDLSVKHQKGMVSVFHQLHCLYNVQKSYFNLQRGLPDDIQPMHVEHCWDYLRQALMSRHDPWMDGSTTS